MSDYREKWLTQRGRPIYKGTDIAVGDFVAIPMVNCHQDSSIRLYEVERVELEDKTVKFHGLTPYPLVTFKRDSCGFSVNRKTKEIYGFTHVHRLPDGQPANRHFHPDREAVRKWAKGMMPEDTEDTEEDWENIGIDVKPEKYWEHQGQPFVVEDELLCQLGGLISAVEIPHLSFLVQSRDINEVFKMIEDAKPEIKACGQAIDALMAKLGSPLLRRK